MVSGRCDQINSVWLGALNTLGAQDYYRAYHNSDVIPFYKDTNILLLDCNDYPKGLRKSYKSIINKARRNYTYVLSDKNDSKIKELERYRDLHHKVSGNKKKSKGLIEAIYNIIKNEDGFLVNIYDKDLHIGTYLFFGKGTQYYYASAATLEDYKKENINHLGLDIGIRYIATKQGCLNFGEMHEDAEGKEKAIQFFKKGFGGCVISTIIEEYMPL